MASYIRAGWFVCTEELLVVFVEMGGCWVLGVHELEGWQPVAGRICGCVLREW